jgi:vitamin B12 transporter
MKENQLFNGKAHRWKHFDRKNYSTFCSLKKEVTIGVLTTATLLFANVESASAQQNTPKQMQNFELQEVEVTGTRVPLTEMKSAKMVTVLSRSDIANAGVQSINDLLKLSTGVDVRQRGGFGIQTDISVCGGTFDQVTILLNGINISSPQTGHLTADFPVAMEDIERVEILEGPSARVFGTSAFTGAINIVTKTDSKSNVTTRLSGGLYGLFNGGASVNYTHNNLSQQLSGNYSRSDGGTHNSDFNTRRFFYQGTYTTKDADISWQAGYSNQKYGANTFYSAAYPNQYEETRRNTFSVKAITKGWLHLMPSLYWNRNYDHFQLIRFSNTGENFHRTDVYGINMNAYFSTILGKTSFGAELRNEGILSTNLGKPQDESQYVTIPHENGKQYTKKDNRTNIDYFIEHNILLSRLTISMGILINRNTALSDGYRYYPGIDISYRPKDEWKVFASWNKALRMPTFTDLYYKSPTQEGNVGLKPEKTQAVKIGAQYRKIWINAKLNAFYNKGSDMIDWVQYTADDKYHSTNFKLDNMGIESNFTFFLGSNSPISQINVGYTYIYQKRHDDKTIYKSNYALEYLRHKFVAGITHRIISNLSASWNFRFQKRMGGYTVYDENHKSTGSIHSYPSFGILDVKVQWTKPHYSVFAQAYNLLDRKYYDFGNLPQPGIWINVGASYRIDI